MYGFFFLFFTSFGKTDHIAFNDIQSDKLTSAVVSFFDRIESLLDINGRIPYIQNSQTSDIMVVNSETAQNMGSRSFQKELRGHHIIVTNVHLSQIPCDRHGLLSLNGSKEIVDMEGIIATFIYSIIY